MSDEGTFEIKGIEKQNVVISTNGFGHLAYMMAIPVDKTLSSDGFAFVKCLTDDVRMCDDGTYTATFEHGKTLDSQVRFASDGYVRHRIIDTDTLKQANDNYLRQQKSISDVMKKSSTLESENDNQMQFE